MNREDYIDVLKAQLDGFSAETRSDILAEIESHIDELALAEKGDAIEQEMGSVGQLVGGLKQELRPNRFQDFLLAVLPTLTLSIFLNILLARFMSPQRFPIIAIVVESLLAVGLVVLLRHRSAELRIYWHGYALIHLGNAALLNSPLVDGANFWSSQWLLVPLLLLLLSVGVGFGRILKAHRTDTLLLTFGLLPFVMQGVAMITTAMTANTISAAQFGNRMMPVQLANYVVTFCVLALIFLPLKRNSRWMGLMLNATLPLFTTSYLLFPDLSQPVIFTLLVAQILVPIMGWQLDKRQRNPYQLA